MMRLAVTAADTGYRLSVVNVLRILMFTDANDAPYSLPTCLSSAHLLRMVMSGCFDSGRSVLKIRTFDPLRPDIFIILLSYDRVTVCYFC